ncbi:MAG: ABC transporter ATP-binding protein [Chitinophagales bacterium]
MDKAIIQINSLYKKYKSADDFALKDFSLLVNKGEKLGLIGPNGAGKTTLLSILFGLIKATSGSFSINNLSYTNHKKSIKSIIGVVPQEYALYPELTAYENLLFFGSMYGLKGSELREKINKYLQYLEIDYAAHKLINTFSGGMKRRINLIAGVLHNPKILFLDEPTVGVDVHSKQLIIKFLNELNLNGTTIVYTSHHLLEAQEFCNRIAFINQGQLLAVDTPKNLIALTDNAQNMEDVFIFLSKKQVTNA